MRFPRCTWMRSGASAVHGDIQQGDETFRGTARLNNRQLASALPAGRVYSQDQLFFIKSILDVRVQLIYGI